MSNRAARQRYLVTGGCGFIGSHLVDSLLADGHDVVVLDDLSTGKRANLDSRAALLVGDIADPAIVARAFDGVTGCFHLAAIASVTKSIEDWLGTHRVNQTGTVNVLNVARKNPVPVVYASSSAVYGDIPSEPIAEDAPAKPITAYGADKLGSEFHAAVAWVVHHVPTTGLRFFNVYGPRQDSSSPYSGVISIFVDRVKAGLPVTIFGDGSQVRDFVFIADAVLHLRMAMAHCRVGAHVYNVCTGRPTSIIQLAELIPALIGVLPQIQFKPVRAGDIRRSLGSPHQTERALGIVAKTKIDDGLRMLMAVG